MLLLLPLWSEDGVPGLLASWLSGVTLLFDSWASGAETRLFVAGDVRVDVTRMDCVLVRPLEGVVARGVERAEGVVGLETSPAPAAAVSLRADVTPLLAEAELTSDVALTLDTALALESARARDAGGIRVLPTEEEEGEEEEEEEEEEGAAEPEEPRTEDRTPRTDVLAEASRLKALSARMDALTVLSLFNVLSLPRKDFREAASRLKPLSVSAVAAAVAAGVVAMRERAELLVERM